MNELLTSFLSSLGLAWWVEITTDNPRCVYYFGPFSDARVAKESRAGYVEDLEQEGAQNIDVSVKRCKPKNLTVYEEGAEQPTRKQVSGILSSQF
jgi:Domain of unknown function (DUF1816)